MIEKNEKAGRKSELTANRARRNVLKTGAMIVPTIVTLHASPSWAGTDYTRVAYSYGANMGLCRNPNFDPRSNASWKRDEFMPCDEIRRQGGFRDHRIAEPETATDDSSSTKDIMSF